jgi:nitroreductase
MNTLEAIRTRRSIRSYKDLPVSSEILHELLAAAMSAPSAGNQQPWEFVIVDDRALLDQIPTIHPYAEMCRQAPVGILVCGDPRREKHPGYWVQDCSAAIQNLLLAAHEKGLGAVWTGIYPREERVADMRKLMKLPEAVVPLAFIVLGYPNEAPPPQDRYREERVHKNGW